MNIVKLPKIIWNRNDGQDFGHDQYEWGKHKQILNTPIVTGSSIPNTDKNSDCVLCGQNYKFIGSEFCSKKCYENYFYSKLN
jgi:hypothetical protein|tara:strand:+ start:209 stop:454 length:246 start_codon:yes stop_codon:yes gene_type:complete